MVVSCWSPRSLFGYNTLSFSSESEFICKGKPIYHTNIAMSVGENFAVVCSDGNGITEGKTELLESLKNLGKEIIEITLK